MSVDWMERVRKGEEVQSTRIALVMFKVLGNNQFTPYKHFLSLDYLLVDVNATALPQLSSVLK